MKKFILKNKTIEITLSNGMLLVIFLTTDSGKVFYRYKIDTISNVKHPGICLGVDARGNSWYMHNHFEDGKPSLVSQNAFSKGQAIFLKNESVLNDRMQVLQLGLQQVINGRPYHAVNYNCQTFVNLATNNKSSSEDVEKWIGRALVGSLILAGFNFFNSK